jgi:GTP-binding nuclear protein Ran
VDRSSSTSGTRRGQEKFGGLRDGYYLQGQCAIIVFDVTSRITYKNVPNCHRDLTRVCENIPIALTGNKVEIKGRKVKAKQITFHRMRTCSTATLRPRPTTTFKRLSCGWPASSAGDNQLMFVVEAPALQPPEATLDDETKAKYEAEIAHAAAVPLPDEEDDDDDL